MKLKHIAIGWSRWLGLIGTTKEAAEESKRRLEICAGCENAHSSKFLEFLSDGPVEVEGKFCVLCTCPCHQKSLTDEMCPIGKWDKK